MTYIKSMFGYLIAFSSIILAIATFAGDGNVGKSIVQHANLQVSPNMYGGDIMKTITRDGYRVIVHEPVFQGLFKPPKEGFIQIDIIPNKNAPAVIREGIDFDEDKKVDFNIRYNTGTQSAEIESFHKNVSTRFMGVKLKSAYTVRLGLTNPNIQ